MAFDQCYTYIEKVFCFWIQKAIFYNHLEVTGLYVHKTPDNEPSRAEIHIWKSKISLIRFQNDTIYQFENGIEG